MVNLDSEPKILFTEEQIKARVKELAHDIAKDYAGKNPLVLAILTGSVFFTADLMKQMGIPLELDFIKASSYGTDGVSSGIVALQYMPVTPLAGRHVLVIEDIVDTGLTLQKIKTVLESDPSNKPASLATVCLLDKPSRRKVEIVPDYVGFSIPNLFVLGYGLDFKNGCRNLPDIRYYE